MKRFIQIIVVVGMFIAAIGIAHARVVKDVPASAEPTVKTIEAAAAGTGDADPADFCRYIVQERFSDTNNSFDVDCKCLDTCFDSVKTPRDNEICINTEERCMAQR